MSKVSVCYHDKVVKRFLWATKGRFMSVCKLNL